MSLSRRLGLPHRPFSSSSIASAFAQREYRGDPGPSSRKTEELRLRTSIRSGRKTLNDRNVLDGLLDASAPEAHRQRPFGEERPRIFPGRPSGGLRPRFDSTSKGFYKPRPLPQAQFEKLQPNPYDTSRQLREWIKAHPIPINFSKLQDAVGIVLGAEKGAVNAVVWNTLLGLVGRQGSLERMWKLYNDMKKSGIEPTSRTYTTLINAYAGVNHAQDISRFTPLQPLESKILQRITTIYNQSQTHISECVEALEQQRRSDSDLGIRGDQDLVEEEEDAEGNTDEEEISLGPMNAYLKFLCKYGRWDDMERIYLAMDTEGPLAPDKITYSLMFSALLSRQQQQKVEFASPITAPKPGEARSPTPKPVDVGSTARPMWERAVRQIHPINRELRLGARQIDTELALLAMQCLLAGQTPDQRLAIALIPFLWDLPTPGSTVVASSTPRSEREIPRSNAKEVPPYMLSLPRLAIDSRAAKTILSMLNRANQATLAAHYAEHLLNTPDLRRHIDWGVLQTCIHALSNTGNIDSILHILDTYQPTTGVDGWPRHIWTNALTAARWSTKFPAALHIFRRMTHLSPGFEHGSPTKFTWTPPNRQPVDIQGRRWIPPRPLQPDAKSMSLLLKTAMYRDNLREIRQAWTVLCHYPLNSFFLIPRNELRDRGLTRDISLLPPFNDELSVPMSKSLMIALEWRLILARDVETVAERILDALMSREEVRTVDEIRKVMGEVARVWGGRMGVHRGGSRVQVSEDEEEDGEELGRNRAVG